MHTYLCRYKYIYRESEIERGRWGEGGRERGRAS